MLAEGALLVALTVEHGSGTSSCLEARQLERAVERRLKRRVFVSGARADLALRVVFARQAEQVEARIELANPDGTPRGSRTLVTSGHCSSLDDSLALSVALLVDEPPDPEPAPAEPSAAPAAGAPKPPTTSPARVITIPPEVAAPREPWHVRLGASAKGAWGVLPGVRPAFALHVTLVPSRFWPIQLQGDAFWPTDAARDEGSGARFRLFRAGLSLCPELLEQPVFAAAVCAGQRLSWLSVEGYGFDHDASQRRLGYALSLGGEGRLRLFAPISLRAFTGVEVPLVRDRFTSGGRNATELFQLSPAAVIGEIGLEATLW
jgi:hypothetical protein